ncbi:hypothetical protein ACFQOZ_17340 [Comamonas endophytica]|uniref:hypothetical protein n=1 Tax=Comamonas endophytica TaxID=2949090 RepID=UPI00361F4847
MARVQMAAEFRQHHMVFEIGKGPPGLHRQAGGLRQRLAADHHPIGPGFAFLVLLQVQLALVHVFRAQEAVQLLEAPQPLAMSARRRIHGIEHLLDGGFFTPPRHQSTKRSTSPMRCASPSV